MGNHVLWRILNKIADFILLNLLCVLFSIPVFTAGASITAMYAVMLKLVREEEGYIVRGFWKEFIRNFKKATAIWMMMVLLFAVLILDLIGINGFALEWFRAPILILCAMFGGIGIYALSLTARFENTIFHTVKNACILFFARIFYSLIMLIITFGPPFFMLQSMRTLYLGMVIYSVIGVSLVVWLNSILLRKIFDDLSS